MTTNNVTFEAALATFLSKLQEREVAYIRANYVNLTPEVFTTAKGRRFVKVIKAGAKEGSQRSVFCFVEKATGNIYKPAGWKQPTLNHVRGNIYGENPLAGTNPHGTNYVGAAAYITDAMEREGERALAAGYSRLNPEVAVA